jgi:hypothetical protein
VTSGSRQAASVWGGTILQIGFESPFRGELIMRKNWRPSVPIEQNVFLVVDDFDRQGRSWREADVKHTDLETVIQDMLEGQYPVQRPRPCDPQVASIPPKR